MTSCRHLVVAAAALAHTKGTPQAGPSGLVLVAPAAGDVKTTGMPSPCLASVHARLRTQRFA